MTSPLAYIYQKNAPNANLTKEQKISSTFATRSDSPAHVEQTEISESIENLREALISHSLALQSIEQRLREVSKNAEEQQKQQKQQLQKIQALATSVERSQNAQISNENLAEERKAKTEAVAEKIESKPKDAKGSASDWWQTATIVLGALLILLLIYWIAKKAQQSQIERTSKAVVSKIRDSIDKMVDDAVSRSLKNFRRTGVFEPKAIGSPLIGSF